MKAVHLFIIAFSFCLFSQNHHSFGQTRLLDLGLEIQVYPAGVVPGIRADLALGTKSDINLRAGYNITKRRDWGVHENEEGGGAGFSFGYRYYLKEGHKGLFFGARTDFWFLKIDWKDNISRPNEIIGETNITVFQPTLEGGYMFLLGEGNFGISPAISFGREINIVTNGEEVGQDFILLIGVGVTKRFN